jgi:hypothetical protein
MAVSAAQRAAATYFAEEFDAAAEAAFLACGADDAAAVAAEDLVARCGGRPARPARLRRRAAV